MIVFDDKLVDAIESIYFGFLVNICLEHGIPRTVALCIATDFFEAMRDY